MLSHRSQVQWQQAMFASGGGTRSIGEVSKCGPRCWDCWDFSGDRLRSTFYRRRDLSCRGKLTTTPKCVLSLEIPAPMSRRSVMPTTQRYDESCQLRREKAAVSLRPNSFRRSECLRSRILQNDHPWFRQKLALHRPKFANIVQKCAQS